MADTENLIFRLVITLIPLILAIGVHEFAHVAMARWLGDDTGTRLGRFTLNPIAHMDPVWTLGVPAMLVFFSSSGAALPFFAAGKPAPYNPNCLDKKIGGKRISIRSAEMWIAAAGPASNVALALLSALLAFIAVKLGVSLEGRSLVWLLVLFYQLNIALAVFNLIPIPPLDGSKVIFALLPERLAQRYEDLAFGMSWILLALVLFIGPVVISPIVGLAKTLLYVVLF